MFKRRVLATIGFTLGTGIVLISLPPTLFNPPETYPVPTEPTPSSTAGETSQSPSPSVSPTPTSSPTAEASAKPTTSVSTEPSTPQTISRIIVGNIYAAGVYGDVQVQIILTNGIITATKALVFPDGDSRSSSISALAIPILIEQTLAAKDSSDIQGVTQASYTTAAWKSSLQSALDKQ